MKYLFSDSGKKLLEALSFTETLYAFDFDGTLAPIVRKPRDARMRPLTGGLLRKLNEVARIAVISGRSLEELRALTGEEVGALVGNHGIEQGSGAGGDSAPARAAREVCLRWKSGLRSRMRALSGRGVLLEDKQFSLAIHYRDATDKAFIRQELIEAFQDLKPTPRVIGGKSVLNLVPPGAPHKGAALLELISRMGVTGALYIGDDDTDEDVFSLLDPRIVTVRVGSRRDSRAQFFIRDQAEVNRVLRSILLFYGPSAGARQAARRA